MENKKATLITLDSSMSIDRSLYVDLSNRDFGHEPDIEKGKIQVYLGNRPIIYNLIELYTKQGKPIPAQWQLFDEYDIWLVSYSVSILKTGGIRNLRQIGLQIRYPDGQSDPKVIILDNMPTTAVKKLASGKLNFSAGLRLNGKVEAPDQQFKIKEKVDLGYGGELSIGVDSKVDFSINFNVISTKVISIGIGNTYGEWLLNKDEDNLLLGDQLFTQTILTTKHLNKIKCDARIYAVLAGPLSSLPVRMEGQWQRLTATSHSSQLDT